MKNILKYVVIFCLMAANSDIMASAFTDKIKAKFQTAKEKIATKFKKEPKETVEAEALSTKQKDYIKKLDEVKKNLSSLLSKIKSIQSEMEKAEKKHKLEGDTSLWMIFQLQISTISSECNYFSRFVTELHTELSKYNKQAKKKGEVEQSVIDYTKRALDNFRCLGRKVNVATARGTLILVMQYMLANPDCPETGRKELQAILSAKHLQILAKNKDFSGLLEEVKNSLYSLLDILATVSLLADGNSEQEDAEFKQAKATFVSIIEGFTGVLSAMQDVVTYVNSGYMSESAAQARLQQLEGNALVSNNQITLNTATTDGNNSSSEKTDAQKNEKINQDNRNSNNYNGKDNGNNSSSDETDAQKNEKINQNDRNNGNYSDRNDQNNKDDDNYRDNRDDRNNSSRTDIQKREETTQNDRNEQPRNQEQSRDSFFDGTDWWQ